MTSSVTKILNGEVIAEELRLELKKKISHFRIQPGLAIILVGHDPASQIYVDFKTKASEEVGITVQTIEYEMTVSEAELLRKINELNDDPKVHGMLVQLPLPDHISANVILSAIDPMKDVDGLHPQNIGRLVMGSGRYLMPATPKGILRLLEETHVALEHKRVVIIGKSLIVGRPLANLLFHTNATVTVCHRATPDLSAYTRDADVLITATGQARLIRANMVKQGVVIIDAGIAREGKRVVGDVDFEEVKTKASFITPVPGGVGPMTVAALLENTWIAMRWQNHYDPE